ncbi:hypothetical protein B0A49_06189 [Cryomyces minteri]|uniref:Sister chromatid cohesion protein n=2 Tax=Cryomyces minteri TaxID=331657 RepID=A0A4U0WVI9_9PEZI|nr:hypothetical protein B0A49_06189 [Cryomyces minteri]
MVLESSSVTYRYPTPVSPESKALDSNVSSPVAKDPEPKSHMQGRSSSRTVNDAAVALSASDPEAADVPSHNTSLVPVVVIPGLASPSQRVHYETFPDIDARIGRGDDSPSKRRNREDLRVEEEVLALNVDQREKADAALRYCQDLIAEIFEAEDRLQSDTSGAVTADAADFFISGIVGERELPLLTRGIQHRLERAIHKAISASRFNAIPVEHLGRVQRLCEGAVTAADGISLGVVGGWTEDDLEKWVNRIASVENGLQASRILLRIMTAGREEKQLYSEDLLQTVMNTVKHVVDSCLVPIAEARNIGQDTESFGIYAAHKKPLSALVQLSSKVLLLLGELLVKVDVAEGAITAVEFLCARLIFVENGHSEKESALGVQKFELLRRTAMDVLAKIFARHPDQRTFIFDEILTSLEKLPVTRQSARQFKLVDGKPIQLVSALLMRLIQTSATRSTHRSTTTCDNLVSANNRHEQDGASDSGEGDADVDQDQEAETDRASESAHDDKMQGLIRLAKPLHDGAQANAHYLVKFMVQRALSSTKTGDQPYRSLLDIFTEDFIGVLGSTDWPAAEMLLRALLSNIVSLMENEKSTAPSKNMALDLLGVMGSGISDLKIHVRSACRSLDVNESELSTRLVQLFEDLVDEKTDDTDFLEFDGPYRIVLEYLQARDVDDAQLQSACGFHLTQWAKNTWTACGADRGSDNAGREVLVTLSSRLKHMILDKKWLENEYESETVATTQARLACALITLNSPFCRAYKRIFSILLKSMTSDHATVKSKSLKSILQLLEKDPSVLDRGNSVMVSIMRCTLDASPLVRDSALVLIGKCLALRPTLDGEVCDRVIERTADAAIGVRKRAMKLLKDIYLRSNVGDNKPYIADALLQRINDTDESVSDLARQTFEDIWISPFHSTLSAKVESVQSRLAVKSQTLLIVKTVQRGEGVLSVLHSLLQSVLSNDSKNAVLNFQVCKAMVAVMFDSIIDSDELSGRPTQAHVLQTLTVFAKASPKLFDAEQLELLQPYVANLSNTDDLLIYRSVIVIFRHVLQHMSSLQHGFLRAIQDALFSSIAKVGRMELNEISSCLWTIDSILNNTDRLVRLTTSVLKGIYVAKDLSPADDTPESAARSAGAVNRVKRLVLIAGYFGKYCDFDQNAKSFKEEFPWWKGDSVAGLVVDIICPLTTPKQPASIRETALESISMICQFWPRQYLRSDTNSAFEIVFDSGDTRLEHIVLSGFQDFFALEEKRSETGAEIPVGSGIVNGSDRLDKTYMATDHDGASTSIAQRFLQHILRIALSSVGELSLTATQVIASINRQGLVHPKECGPALVALETSPNAKVASIATQEHRALHQKHESMFEKEYMRAVRRAFMFQKEVIRDTQGFTTQPFASKLRLLFDVLKTGNDRVRRKFLGNVCMRLDFELSKLNSAGGIPAALEYARFCVENLAFFEYSRIDELLYLVACIEKVVANTGTVVANAIETEVLKDRPQPGHDGGMTTADTGKQHLDSSVDLQRLRHLTVASMILMLMWETRSFLQRLWGLRKYKETKTKPATKEVNKSPVKTAFVTGDKFVEKIKGIMSVLCTHTTQLDHCRTFLELLNVDNDLKVASETEDNDISKASARYETPSEERNLRSPSLPPSGGVRAMKRKGSGSIASTPRKKRVKPQTSKKKTGSVSRSKDSDDEWD